MKTSTSATLRKLTRKSIERLRRAGGLLLAATAAVVVPACGGDSGVDYPALRPIDTAALQTLVETRSKDMLVPGTVVILQTPKGNFTSTYGVTTYQGSTPTSVDQHMRVGSVTKTWTGTVILQQVQDGLLKLDDPVSKYRPDVPNGDNITIEQLLNMRSGLYNYSTLRQFNQTLDDEPQKVWTQDEVLALAFAQQPYFAPGTGFHYSNTNIILLGLIAQQLENGKPLETIMQDRLFKPLGMKGTALPPTTSNLLPEPFSHGYMYGSNVLTMPPTEALPPDMQAAARAGTLAPVDRTAENPSWGWAAGSGYSTANDLVKWVKAMVGGGLLNADMQAKRLASLQSVNPDDPESPQYGWAIAKFGALYGHTGELPGFNTFAGYDPENDVTLIVWTNLEPSPDGSVPATTIAQKIVGQIYVPR